MADEIIDIQELRQDVHNFNKGTEDGQALIEKSFQELGAGRSVLVDKDGQIIAGNKSQKAAIKAGIKKVRVIETDGSELIAVKRTDVSLDSEMGRKLALADNATAKANLVWDEVELNAAATELGIDLEEWGVELPDMADPMDNGDAKEDDFNEAKDPVETVVQRGEIWALGEHKLMCGDSTRAEDVQRLMAGEKADLWLTDPPYNVAVENSQGMTIANDNMSSSDFRKFLCCAFAAAKSVLEDGCPFYIWFASKEHINFEGALNDNGLMVRQELIWNKNHFILGRSHYQWKHEPCLYGWNGGGQLSLLYRCEEPGIGDPRRSGGKHRQNEGGGNARTPQADLRIWPADHRHRLQQAYQGRRTSDDETSPPLWLPDAEQQPARRHSAGYLRRLRHNHRGGGAAGP